MFLFSPIKFYIKIPIKNNAISPILIVMIKKYPNNFKIFGPL